MYLVLKMRHWRLSARPLLSPFGSAETELRLGLPPPALQGPVLCSLASQFFSSAPLRPPPPHSSASHMHLQHGNLIQVEGVGEAAPGVLVWL